MRLSNLKSRNIYLSRLNIENRIGEDEKLRNISKKLVNSKSNDRTTKREAKASEINESINILIGCRS